MNNWAKQNSRSTYLNSLYVVKGNHIKKVNNGIKRTSLFEDNQTYFYDSGK